MRQTLGHQHAPEAQTLVLPPDDDPGDVIHQLLNVPALMVHFLRNHGIVGTGRQCALQHQVGRVSSHDPNEVPILGIGGGVNHQVGDQGRVCVGARGETDAGLQLLVGDVVVDGGRDADDAGAGVVPDEVVG